MATNWVPGVFTWDGEIEFPGWHTPGEYWNGFACPAFTLDTVRKIADVINAPGYSPDEQIEIDADGRVWTVWTYCDGDGVDRQEIEPLATDDGTTVFPVGAWAWTWDLVEPDCPVCGTDAEEWDADGCGCWFCPGCKRTNPATLARCETCERERG